jgi:hypothetical protein
MKKEDIPVVGKIIATKIREIDTSTIGNEVMEDTIKYIENLYQFEDDKTEMNRLIEEIKDIVYVRDNIIKGSKIPPKYFGKEGDE